MLQGEMSSNEVENPINLRFYDRRKFSDVTAGCVVAKILGIKKREPK